MNTNVAHLGNEYPSIIGCSNLKGWPWSYRPDAGASQDFWETGMNVARKLMTEHGEREFATCRPTFCLSHANAETPALLLPDGPGRRFCSSHYGVCKFAAIRGAVRCAGILNGRSRYCAVKKDAISGRDVAARAVAEKRFAEVQHTLQEIDPIWRLTTEACLRWQSNTDGLSDTLRLTHKCWQSGSKRTSALMSQEIGAVTGSLPRVMICERPGTIGIRLHALTRSNNTKLAGFATRLRAILEAPAPTNHFKLTKRHGVLLANFTRPRNLGPHINVWLEKKEVLTQFERKELLRASSTTRRIRAGALSGTA